MSWIEGSRPNSIAMLADPGDLVADAPSTQACGVLLAPGAPCTEPEVWDPRERLGSCSCYLPVGVLPPPRPMPAPAVCTRLPMLVFPSESGALRRTCAGVRTGDWGGGMAVPAPNWITWSPPASAHMSRWCLRADCVIDLGPYRPLLRDVSTVSPAASAHLGVALPSEMPLLGVGLTCSAVAAVFARKPFYAADRAAVAAISPAVMGRPPPPATPRDTVRRPRCEVRPPRDLRGSRFDSSVELLPRRPTGVVAGRPCPVPLPP